MKIVSDKDYFFSMRRGAPFEVVKIVLIHIFKKCLFGMCAILFAFKSKKNYDPSLIKKIVIYIPQNSGMGDLIMSALFFKALREKFLNAEIIVYTKNGIMINKLHYNSLIEIGKLSFFKQLSLINKSKVDLFLLPEKSIISSFMFLFCRSHLKLGYLSKYILSANFNIKPLQFIPHKDHYYLKSYQLINALESNVVSDNIVYSPDLSFMTNNTVTKSPDYIVFIPSVLWGNRSISFDDSKKVVAEVLKSRFHIFLCGGQESLCANHNLLKEFSSEKDKIMYQKKLTLIEFIEVIKNSKGVICGDSGPMHIAFGFQKPVFSFWGPTFPELRLPSSNNKRSQVIFEKNSCQVSNCYNMEHKPFCKTCLRLENIPEFSAKLKSYLMSI